MNTPSILLLTRALDTGGSQRQLVELALALQRRGWKVAVATFYGNGLLERPLQAAGIPIFFLNKRGRWDVFPFVWRLITVMRRERPHFVKGFLVTPNILLSALRPALGKTRVVWRLGASDMDLGCYDFLSKLEFRVSILLSRWAHLIISNSEAGRRYHIDQGYSAKHLVVVPNGIDVQQFRPDAAARREVRAEWKITPDVRLIGLVGRVDPMKDHPNFLHAAAKIATSRPETRFVCVGPGEESYRKQMIALGNSLGLKERLLWAGERTDMSRVYNALDLLVSSSRFGEGLPNAVAEAMATGVPCVVTNVGDSALLVGERGWVCPPGDSTALAQGISTALTSLPADSAAIRMRICTHYSTDALARGTAEQLRKLSTGAEPARGLTSS
jgi:glycosyltransferase involved in cell wall biosynthesis